MVSWSLAGRRSGAEAVAARLARVGRRAYLARGVALSALRLIFRFVLLLAGLALGVAAVAILAGVGWALLAGGVACWILESIIKDDPTDSRAAARRG